MRVAVLTVCFISIGTVSSPVETASQLATGPEAPTIAELLSQMTSARQESTCE